MTLTDFLLARIAEDEEFWTVVAESKQVSQQRARRTLARIQSHRTIVLAAAHNDEPTEMHLSALTLDWVAAVLALPYDDHPDYREEWKS